MVILNEFCYKYCIVRNKYNFVIINYRLYFVILSKCNGYIEYDIKWNSFMFIFFFMLVRNLNVYFLEFFLIMFSFERVKVFVRDIFRYIKYMFFL